MLKRYSGAKNPQKNTDFFNIAPLVNVTFDPQAFQRLPDVRAEKN